MAGYTGYHSNKGGWSGPTIAAVVLVHVIGAYGLYQLSETEFIRDLIQVTKLITVPEPPKPPEPPPPEEKPEPEPEPLPEIPPEPVPPVKEAPPDTVEPAAPEPQSSDAAQEGEAAESGTVADAPFAIGKKGDGFSGYEGILTASIQSVYQQPPDLPSNVEYAVLCQIELDEEGYVLGYRLVGTSGHPVFDKSAQMALSRLRQVRPPPPGMSRTIVVKFFPP